MSKKRMTRRQKKAAYTYILNMDPPKEQKVSLVHARRTLKAMSDENLKKLLSGMKAIELCGSELTRNNRFELAKLDCEIRKTATQLLELDNTGVPSPVKNKGLREKIRSLFLQQQQSVLQYKSEMENVWEQRPNTPWSHGVKIASSSQKSFVVIRDKLAVH